MVITGTLRGENYCKILFSGDVAACKKYISTMRMSDYLDINLCRNNGIIEERIYRFPDIICQ